MSIIKRWLVLGLLTIGTWGWAAQGPDLKFADLAAMDSSIVLDIRYATPDNFTGKTVYPSARCILREDFARRLEWVQQDLRRCGYGLKIYDGYRPVAVQKIFWRIMPDERYVADPAKGSRHNRGAAVDVGLVDSAGRALPMPSGYDDFSEEAHRDYRDAPEETLRNSKILEDAMSRQGFEPLPTEWWHFDAPGWKQYPVSDRPLWTVSKNIVTVAAVAHGPALAGFYMAQDYGLFGDVDVRFIITPEALEKIGRGEADIAVAPQKDFWLHAKKDKSLVAVAVAPTRRGQRGSLYVVVAAKQRRSETLIKAVLAGFEKGNVLVRRHRAAAAAAVIRRTTDLTYERAAAEVDAPAGIRDAGVGDLPVRPMYPVSFAVCGAPDSEPFRLAVACAEGTEAVIDSTPVVVRAEKERPVVELLEKGLAEFGFVEAENSGALPANLKCRSLRLGRTGDKMVFMCAGIETPDVWADGVFALTVQRWDILRRDFPWLGAIPPLLRQ